LILGCPSATAAVFIVAFDTSVPVVGLWVNFSFRFLL